MKKLIVAAMVATLAFAGTSLVFGQPGATMTESPTGNDGSGIINSSHDFSDNLWTSVKTGGEAPLEVGGWNNRQEICRVCHAPHDKGRVLYENGLLWNHTTSSLTFTMYSDLGGFDTLDGTVAATPQGSSKLCLSCHDGATNIDAFDGKIGTFNITAYSNSSINQGASAGNLHGNHPISISYEMLLDGELADPAVGLFDDGKYIADVLESGRVECASCHDVHNKNTAAGSSLLRSPNTLLTSKGGNGIDTASKLCLTCHLK